MLILYWLFCLAVSMFGCCCSSFLFGLCLRLLGFLWFNVCDCCVFWVCGFGVGCDTDSCYYCVCLLVVMFGVFLIVV